MKRFSLRRFLLALLMAILFSGFGLVLYQAGNYFSYLDAYSGHIVRQDESAAREGLSDLRYFYEQNMKLDKVYLSWIGRNYILEDPACQRAAFYNLTKDYDKTVDELKDKESFCAAFLRGNARWRQAQAITARALTLPSKTDVQKAEKEKQLKLADDMAATFAKDDFEVALKANPSHAPSSWNYDLLSNPETRAKGLTPKPGKIKIRVGQSPGGGPRTPGPKGEDDKGEGKKSKDIDTNDKGPGQPGGKPRKTG